MPEGGEYAANLRKKMANARWGNGSTMRTMHKPDLTHIPFPSILQTPYLGVPVPHGDTVSVNNQIFNMAGNVISSLKLQSNIPATSYVVAIINQELSRE